MNFAIGQYVYVEECKDVEKTVLLFTLFRKDITLDSVRLCVDAFVIASSYPQW